MVPFWGRRYRDYFVELALPSLLAPGNLGSLRRADGHRFFIATTREDWAAIDGLPAMEHLRRHAETVFLDIGSGGEGAVENASISDYVVRIRRLTAVLKLLLEAAYRERSYGSLLLPDLIYSDGMGASLAHSVEAGDQLVLCAALRQSEEPLLAEIRARGLLPSHAGDPLVLAPRLAADLAVRHLHPEVSVFEDGHRAQPLLWPFRYWRLRHGAGLVLQAFFSLPVLMDMRLIDADHADCLDEADFEHVYVSRNFGACERIRVVRDSDEFSFLSLTPAAVNWSPTRPRIGLQSLAPNFYHRCSIRASCEFYAGRNADAPRRETARLPIRWHGESIDDAWLEEERPIVASFGDVFTTTGGVPVTVGLLLRWEVVRARLAKLPLVLRNFGRALGGDPAARQWVRRSFRVLWLQLVSPSSTPTIRNVRN
jgi:hypothetical protein